MTRIAAPLAAFTAPLPGTCDPRYEDKRAGLMQWLDATRDYQRLVIELGQMTYGYDTDPSVLDETYTQRVLTRRKVYAPAPFVGRPYCYCWWAAVDADGLGLGGENVFRMEIDGGPLFTRYLMESEEMAPVRSYRDGWDDGYAAAKRRLTEEQP